MADSAAADQPSEPPSPATATAYHLHPRREPFEHGLLPIPKLIFSDGAQTLSQLKSALLSPDSNQRVNSEALARVLQIPIEHSRLIIETISSVLHDESDPLLKAGVLREIDEIGVNVFDLLIFLYIQSYKRLLPKGHRDSAAVADVWPSTSAFDGFLSALSPLQLVRSNSRRYIPSQADEEAHQLSYLQKHIGNILSLLADSTEGEGDESLVLSMDKFEHLGFLLYFGEKGSAKIPLSQSTPFFANSDPDMPAAPVPASQVLDWLLQSISSTQEHISDRVSPKENGPSSSDQDVQMADVGTTSLKPSSSPRGPSFIEGVSKSSCVKHASDLKGTSVKVVNCHESVIYILAPLRYATVYGCSDATIVIGAVGKAIRVEHCERVHLITAARRICIANCRECVFFLGVNQQPLIVGDNHKLQVAPYNTFYSQLEEHINEVGVDPKINRWDESIALGVVDPHDSLSHPAGVSDVQAESATRVDPDQFTDLVIPNWLEGEQSGSTKDNPFPLPDAYIASQQKKEKSLGEVKQMLREAQLEDNRKRELSSALHSCFKDWLYVAAGTWMLSSLLLQMASNI
ncbi:Tubulin binding cofactor C domain-containing protein [Perilla frutescens var. hirtella]|uniref:TBCC domain-containing protein 1 n=1 Tax=Perilla frutescens var. hirtella TaxID=608512 RepID=A0AAD4P4D8_PERFH|nr:Tubulin binding cofactor C domain-containing protein [Perilla frutescens var. frutescens]KAH6825806.1 Tubulin binding cofactor C domain-containing protein [Perilla frutescens var. hirtella]